MYTGILLRTDTHPNFAIDLLVHRELAVSPSGLGIGVDRGSGVETFWLNYEALAKIGLIAANGTVTPGFKTSDIPITFDSGTLKEDVNGIKVNDNLLHNSLSYISSVSALNLIFTDKATTPVLTTVNIAGMAMASKPAPILSVPTTTSVTTNQDSTVIEAEDGTVIGTGSAGAITLSPAQVSAARIYAYTLDIHKNRSIRTSILIP
jgi:hypothetical protein